MEIIRVREKIIQPFRAPAVALGNFDGVHLGHQEIIRRTVETAGWRGHDAVVYTFDPHPRVVLNKAPEIPKITTLAERAKILEHMGVHVLILAEFTLAFASQPPTDFVHNILVEELGAQDVFIGENYRFGKDRLGTSELLRELGPEMGFRVHVVEPLMSGNVRVSSSRIREHLLKGELEEANRLLGREFTVEGRVIHGHHRGKTLGFPTANIKPDPKLHPPTGVYAAFCRVGADTHPAVMNIGYNPTFKGRKVSYEIHILDFDADLYGQHIKAYLVSRLRPELTFNGPDELIAQINKDIERCRALLTVKPRFP